MRDEGKIIGSVESSELVVFQSSKGGREFQIVLDSEQDTVWCHGTSDYGPIW